MIPESISNEIYSTAWDGDLQAASKNSLYDQIKIITAGKPFTTATNPAVSAATSTAVIDDYGGTVITLTVAGNAQTIGNPTIVTAGKDFTVVNNDTSSDPIAVNGIDLAVGVAQRFVWDGSAWIAVEAVDAGDITNIPAGTIVATNVQAAIDELDSEKMPVLAYRTVYVPANQMTPTATNGPTAGTKEFANNDINVDYYAFDTTTEEFVEFEFPMPEEYNLGTIKVKFFWSSATGSTAGDTVEWKLAAGAQSDNDAIDAALGSGEVISDALLADGGADRQLTSATGAITIGGTPALADMVHFKVSRNVGGTDDMAEDAWLFGCWIQFGVLTVAPSAW